MSLPATMRAAVLHGKEDLRLETVPLATPEPGGATSSLVMVQVAAPPIPTVMLDPLWVPTVQTQALAE